MPARLRTVLFNAGSIVLAGTLLYLALRGVSFAEIRDVLAGAAYGWLLPWAFVTLLSHYLRALRWKILLDELPGARGPKARPATAQLAFFSVMIGYMINYIVPRVGEAVRAANVSAQSSLRFSGVFGTVVVGRLLDVIVWGVSLIGMVWLFLGRFEGFQERFLDPALARLEGLPLLPLAFGVLGVGLVAVVLFVGLHVWRRTDDAAPPTGLLGRLRAALTTFADGLTTILRSRKRLQLVLLTVAMWGCYALVAHVPFYLLGMAEPYGITIIDSWGLMVLGSLGVALPSPGGVGTYHYVITQALVFLFAVPQAEAVSYAVITHGFQLLLYVAVGALCLVLQGPSLRALRATAERHTTDDAALPAPPAQP